MEKKINIRRNLWIALLLMMASGALFLFYNLGNSWEFALRLRGLKVVAILVVAGCVAFSSVAFQTLTNNRILTPSIMGFESLYLLIQTVIVYLYSDQTYRVLSSIDNFLVSVANDWIFFHALSAHLQEGEDNLYRFAGGDHTGTHLPVSALLCNADRSNDFFIVQGKMFALQQDKQQALWPSLL